MSDNKNDYGILLNKDIKLHRGWFKQMTKLIGINCIYKKLRPGKRWDDHGDLDSKYEPGELIGVIFNEHPDQKTLKKMGWVAELQEGSSIIHVPYDLDKLEVGCLFVLPGGLDNAQGRVFRVISMSNIMVYPASISCEIAPEYETTTQKAEINNFTKTTTNVLVDNEEDD